MNSHTPPRDIYLAQSLPADRRSALRTALKNAAGWENYRNARSLSLEAMGKADLIDAALALSLDLSPYFPGATDTTSDDDHHKPRPYSADQVVALKGRFIASLYQLTAKNREFIEAVFVTIDTKQDGRATEKQYATIARILERAEGKADTTSTSTATTSTSTTTETTRTITPTQVETMTPAPMTTTAPTNDPAQQLAALLAQMAGQSINPETVARIVDERINAALATIPSVKIECRGPDSITRKIEGHQHPKFKTLLRMASARMANGYAPSIWLAGPAGSGKTHAGHMLADALGLPFHLNGALSMPHELLGFIDAGGTYHRTPFREAYEHGGVYMFDEVDGSDNSALLALNAALANGQATFPDAKIERHANCIILASANTWGLGATAEYVGRAKIDAAFLSRFPGRINWDYDVALEIAISGNESFARRVIAARERARVAGIKVLIDPRASQAGAAYIAAGMTEDEAAELTYLANVTKDQRKILEG